MPAIRVGFVEVRLFDLETLQRPQLSSKPFSQFSAEWLRRSLDAEDTRKVSSASILFWNGNIKQLWLRGGFTHDFS